MVLGLEVSGRHVADGLEQPLMLEPLKPGEHGVLGRVKTAPWSAPIEQRGPVKADDALEVQVGSEP
jgi:hypothetical protein